MIKKVKYYINHWYDIPIIKEAIEWSKKVVIPGFEGIALFYIFRFLVEETKQDRMMTRANSMAFSFFVSMFPAIIFLFTLLPHLDITHQLDQSITSSIYGLMPKNASQYLLTIIHDITGIKRQGLLSFGFILALYFASQGVLTMMIGFDKGHLTGFENRSYTKKILISIALTMVLLMLVIASATLIVLGDIIINGLDELWHLKLLNSIMVFLFRWLLAVAIIYVAITIIYRYAPSMTKRVSFWNIGSFMATILSLLTSLTFAYFINNFGKYNEVYGSIGALLVLLLWLKINAFIILFGFELNTSVVANKNRLMSKDV